MNAIARKLMVSTLSSPPKQQQQPVRVDPIEFKKQKDTFERFQKRCPVINVKIDGKNWSYRQCYQDSNVPPLIILHDFCGSSHDFYNQFSMIFDEGKDFHFISVEIPSHCTTIDEFVPEFDKFVNLVSNSSSNHIFSISPQLRFSEPISISNSKSKSQCVHLCGCGLGAFLALNYASEYVEKVSSLILVNGFVNSTIFSEYSPLNDFYVLAPKFLLSTKVFDMFTHFKDREFMNNDEILYSIEYMLDNVDKISQKQLASRLSLLSDERIVNTKDILEKLVIKSTQQNSCITIIESMDDENSIYPSSLRTELQQKFPSSYSNIRSCLLKKGGTFPYISNVDEFNIYLTVHMRGIYQNISLFDNLETLQVSSPTTSGDLLNAFSPELLDSSKSNPMPVLYRHISFTPHTPPDIAEEDITTHDCSLPTDMEADIFCDDNECEGESMLHVSHNGVSRRRSESMASNFEEDEEEHDLARPKDMLF
ncbi:predicted protein [Naegleria gruberi]|uniref:Maspardin n=1 Tax=Naegleria gruberi TaxID=5762 RepID=D2VYL1_NAEGR|nr:uncharacterized protein NAEGRDRAFT_59598 [Naegleria gruberi]EFC38133.1 predicted protein [Naegleria gruberi]|eukprot:XP_002670877.1 predicted protein [Naegleria gruberi strain NEG-M]